MLSSRVRHVVYGILCSDAAGGPVRGIPCQGVVSKTLNAELPAAVDRSMGTDGSLVYTRAPQVSASGEQLPQVGGRSPPGS